MNDRDKDAEEARRALAALSRDGGLLGSGPQMRDQEGEPQDAVEIWAKRIGRALGLIFLVLLAVNLFTGWFF